MAQIKKQLEEPRGMAKHVSGALVMGGIFLTAVSVNVTLAGGLSLIAMGLGFYLFLWRKQIFCGRGQSKSGTEASLAIKVIVVAIAITLICLLQAAVIGTILSIF